MYYSSPFRDNNRQRVVDHRLQNLTPNRRQDIRKWNNKQFETTSERVPNKNRNRFGDIDGNRDRDENLSSRPLASISFGKLPYPSGNSYSDQDI